jgi:uncharacterized protein (TIGR03437 family)
MRYLADLVKREGCDLALPYYHRNWRRRDAPLLDRLGAVIDHVEAHNGSVSVISNLGTAVFTQNQSGSGPGAIEVVKPDGTQFLNTPSAPATAGDVLVIYCTGLGEVSPPVPDGAAAPSSPLSRTVQPVTVTMGGHETETSFAGLAPGYTGLYQVNVTVPSGIGAGGSVPMVLTVAGQVSPPVTVALQ